MKKLLFLLPILLLLFNQKDNEVLVAFDGYGKAYADTVRIYTDTLKTGQSRAYNSFSKASARNKETGNANSASVIAIGVDYGYQQSTQFSVSRSLIALPLPTMASKPDTAELRLYGATNRSDIDSLINIFGAESARAGGFTTADFHHFDGWNDSVPAPEAYTGTKLADDWNTTSMTTTGFNKIVFNSAGLDYIYAHQGDTLFVMLVNLKDYYNTWAGAGQDSCTVSFQPSSAARIADGKAAHLWVDYPPPSTPSSATRAKGQRFPGADMKDGRVY